MATTMKRVIVIGATTLAVVGVAGCESNSRSGRSIVFASEAGTAAEALDDGKTLVATSHTTGNVSRDFASNTTELAAADFTIKTNAQGGVDVTLDGETYSFAASDRDGLFGWRTSNADGDEAGVYSYNGNVDMVLDPTDPAYGDDYSQIWDYFFYDDATEMEHVGHAVVGTETKAEALEGKAVATYSGYAAARLYDKTDPTARARLEADVDMTADFANGTMEGQLTNLSEIVGQDAAGNNIHVPFAGTVMMEEASIIGNSYEGQLSSSGIAGGDLSNTSTYSGRFYGPSAEETAGVLNLETPDAVGSGAYRAFENP